MSRLTLAFVALSLSLLTSCTREPTELRMLQPVESNFDPSALQLIFSEHSNARLTLAEGVAGMSPLEALTSNMADLSVVENSATFVSGVRVILPVYESVLHVLVKEGFTSSDSSQSLSGASFHIANNSEAGHTFVDLLTRRHGLGPDDFRKSQQFEPGVTDIIIYFGPVDTDNISWYRSGYSFSSLNGRFNPQRKYYDQGVGYIAPKMHTKVIPALTYTNIPGNEQPVLTLAVEALLVTRRDVPESVIFGITETLLEQKPRFTAVAPSLFDGVAESFDRYSLSFPLHSGARRYLERDEPGLLERYAETINLLIYLVFMIMTALLGLARWRARRKKDRIDTFYVRVLGIEERIQPDNHDLLRGELTKLESEAFDSLIKEKLAADESFRIFTDLMARTRRQLDNAIAVQDQQ
jgi:TRAP-type uncharacterized transport system substrate-binding protein